MALPVGGHMGAEMGRVHARSVVENRREVLAVRQPPAAVETRCGAPLERNNAQALRRDRRLARRALMIARPARVRMRARKPWVLLRFTSLG